VRSRGLNKSTQHTGTLNALHTLQPEAALDELSRQSWNSRDSVTCQYIALCRHWIRGQCRSALQGKRSKWQQRGAAA
jgi:hypothetical protein